MTPTEAREITKTAFGPSTARTVITKLADQVEALKAERDQFEIAMRGWIAENSPGGWIDNLRREREGLAIDIRQMANDLTAIEKLRGEKDARMHSDMHKLKEAAKLALGALSLMGDELNVALLLGVDSPFEQDTTLKAREAIAALKKAGIK